MTVLGNIKIHWLVLAGILFGVIIGAVLNNMYVEHTGQELETIENALERDRYMTPEEAADFGLIDEVVLKRPEEEDGASDFSDDEGEDQGKE